MTAMHIQTIPEILAPAGDAACLSAALQYGADAVYLAGTRFGMRAAPANFDEQGLRDAVKAAHTAGKRVYVTCNILPRNAEIDVLPAYLEMIQDTGADALIVADLAVMALAKRYAPRCELHVSTQFGVVNYATAQMLYDMGAARVVLARELPLSEIAEIRARIPSALELECFVHGAMCMSFSGRCLLSNYLTGRDANHGCCTQPCRWKYQLLEPGRPEQPLTVEENAEGTYLFNANDLCMLPHVAALAQAGISSFKIEGRAKAAYYVAVVTNTYRQAMDGYRASGCAADYRPPAWLEEELDTVSHRPYGTGFYFGQPAQETKRGGYIRHYEVAAVVEGWQDGRLLLSQRNRFCRGDVVSILQPGRQPVTWTITEMYDPDNQPLEAAPHATMPLWIPYPQPVEPGSFLRRRLN